MSNFATGHAVNTLDFFIGLDIKKLKTSWKTCDKVFKTKNKRVMASKIWKECLDLVLLDIINNSDTFKLPTTSRSAEIHIKSFDKDLFIAGRQNGKWQDIDYLASNFTGYLPIFKFQRAGYLIEKPIYVDNKRKLLITDRVNSGKTYY